jgi:tetratricopeptide (TPR) repeat protein
MKFRGVSSAVTTGFLAIACAAPAGAAVSVLGTGLPQVCFEAAEYGSPQNAEEGVRSCTDALQNGVLSPHDRAATLINRGILRARDNDVPAAMEDYNEGLSLDATLGEGYVDRGASEIVLKDFDAALSDISKGIDLHAQRAIVNEALGNIRDAYADYKKAVELQPDFQLANDQLMRFRVVRKHGDGA